MESIFAMVHINRVDFNRARPHRYMHRMQALFQGIDHLEIIFKFAISAISKSFLAHGRPFQAVAQHLMILKNAVTRFHSHDM
jgi:hypothetical protein